MFTGLIYTFLISISPLGEARAGIPYAVINHIPVGWAFLIGWSANLLVFPLFYNLIEWLKRKFGASRVFRKYNYSLEKRAKNQTKSYITKYGFWGLMVFVMIPLPITGAYTGTIAAHTLKMDYRKSFLAISVGVTISCIIIAIAIYLGVKTFG